MVFLLQTREYKKLQLSTERFLKQFANVLIRAMFPIKNEHSGTALMAGGGGEIEANPAASNCK